MNKYCSTYGILSVTLLSGVILLGGCHSGLLMKRRSELACPTDIRQKIPWCAGEDALFSCPCGPDGEFYGMKPTCWSEWPASGADWRNAFCGPPAERCPLSTSEALSEAPLPTSVDDSGEFYNPFGSSLQMMPMPQLTEELAKEEVSVDKLQNKPSSEEPDSVPALPEVTSEKATPDSQDLKEQYLKDKQGALHPLPATQPGLSTSSLRSKPREPQHANQVHQQVSLAKLVIPPAPVADKPSSVVLVELRQQVRSEASREMEILDQKESMNRDESAEGLSKPDEATGTEETSAFFEWPMSVNNNDAKEPSVQIDVIPHQLPLVQSAKIEKVSVQTQRQDHLAKRYKSPLFAQ